MTDAPDLRRAAADAQEIDSLRSTVEALDQRIAELKAALHKYATHEWPCWAWHPRGPADDPRCDCGLRYVLARSPVPSSPRPTNDPTRRETT